MTALPPIYLHVWCAAAAGGLPGGGAWRRCCRRCRSQDYAHARDPWDPVAAKKRIAKAKKTGENLGRMFTAIPGFPVQPSEKEAFWLLEETQKLGIEHPTVLTPLLAVESIPFGGAFLGCKTSPMTSTPLRCLVQKATYEWPAQHGRALLDEQPPDQRFLEPAEPRFQGVYPPEPSGTQVLAYLWAVPSIAPIAPAGSLSPNWSWRQMALSEVLPHLGNGRRCQPTAPLRSGSASEQSDGTVKGGAATCPYPDCGRDRWRSGEGSGPGRRHGRAVVCGGRSSASCPPNTQNLVSRKRQVGTGLPSPSAWKTTTARDRSRFGRQASGMGGWILSRTIPRDLQ